MKYFEFITRNSSKIAMIIASLFLLAAMFLTVANVVLRASGGVIAGTYELTEVFIIAVAAGALGYCAYHGAHVAVDSIVVHFSGRVRGILESLTSAIVLAAWGVITWTSTSLLINRWGQEETELLDVSFIPFRLIWIFGLIALCLALLRDLFYGLRKAAKK